jgi:transposase
LVHLPHSLLASSTLSWIVTSLPNIYQDTMPRKPRSKPLRQHYTRDLKRRVIYQAEVLGYSSTKIAIELSMPLTVVQRVRRTWSEIGEVCRDRKYKGRAPIMSNAAVSVSLHFPCLLVWILSLCVYTSACLDFWTTRPTCSWMKFKTNYFTSMELTSL